MHFNFRFIGQNVRKTTVSLIPEMKNRKILNNYDQQKFILQKNKNNTLTTIVLMRKWPNGNGDEMFYFFCNIEPLVHESDPHLTGFYFLLDVCGFILLLRIFVHKLFTMNKKPVTLQFTASESIGCR